MSLLIRCDGLTEQMEPCVKQTRPEDGERHWVRVERLGPLPFEAERFFHFCCPEHQVSRLVAEDVLNEELALGRDPRVMPWDQTAEMVTEFPPDPALAVDYAEKFRQHQADVAEIARG